MHALRCLLDDVVGSHNVVVARMLVAYTKSNHVAIVQRRRYHVNLAAGVEHRQKGLVDLIRALEAEADQTR